MTKYQKTDKSWLKIDPETGFEKQHAVGFPKIWDRNPDLRLHGFDEPRPPDEEAWKEFYGQMDFTIEFFYRMGKKYIKDKVEIDSIQLTADCNKWWYRKGREVTIHEGSMIVAVIMEGYPYKRLDGGHVIFKMDKT